jgi:DNA-binding winged helix-turn-helix (wHTH) protein
MPTSVRAPGGEPAHADEGAGASLGVAVAFGPYHIPDDVDLLFRGDAVVALEPRAVRLLRYLARSPGRVVPKRELLAEVWPHQFVTDDVLKQAVAKARRALGADPAGGAWIETFHARGYRFSARTAVRRADARASAPPDAADTRDFAEALHALHLAADAVAALAARLAART